MSGALGAVAALLFALALVAFAVVPDLFALRLVPPLWSIATLVATGLIVAPVVLAWWLVLRAWGAKR